MYDDILYDFEPLTESMKFKSVEEAEEKLKKLSNGMDTSDKIIKYIKLALKFGVTPVLLINAGGILVPIPIGMIIIQSFSKWMAMPGSTNDKCRDCKKLLKEIDKHIKILESKDGKEYKQNLADLKKFREKVEKEHAKYEVESQKLGNYQANYENFKINLSNHYTGKYINEAMYDEYIANKISNEKRIFEAVNEMIIRNQPINEQQRVAKLTVLYEAKLSDKIKANWSKFINFIKSVMSKFMESMTNLLLNEQDYLKKYKDIILKKQLKIEFSYTGNYPKGIQRLNNVQIPVFNYASHSESLKRDVDNDSYQSTMQKLISDFSYDNGETLAEMCKKYFLCTDDGEKEISAKNAPNMTDMYNYCFNFSKIKSIVDKDLSHLESSTTAISNAIHAKLNEAMILLREEGEGESKPEADSKENKGNTGLQINTNSASGTSSYENRDSVSGEDREQNANDASQAGETDNSIDNIINKWITICKTIITSKWTAAEQIAKDYMAIIRAHVRSYVGKDEDKADKKSVQKGTNYAKNDNQEDSKATSEDNGKPAPKG